MATKGPGGKEVGRISIRVVPDTTRFRDRLKKDLEALEKTLKGELGMTPDMDGFREKVKAASSGMEATVKVDADTNPAKTALDRFQRRMLSEMQSNLGKLESKIDLTVDGEKFRRSIEGATKRLSNEIHAKIPLDVELAAGQRAKISSEIAAIKKMAQNDTIQLRLDPEWDYKFRQRLKTIIPDDGIKLKLDPQFDYQLRQRLKKMGAIKVPVELTFREKLSGFLKKGFSDNNRFGRINRGILDLGSNALSALGGIRAFGIGLAGLLAIASLLVPAVSILSGALVALPGFLTGAIAPIAAVALGLDGIKKAAQSAGLPEAFKSLRESVSKVFEAGLAPTFTRLLDIMPALNSGFGAVAQGVVSMADGFVNAVTSSRGMSQIEGTLFNIGAALDRAAPGVEKFTSGMLTLVNSFSTKFPGMADAFNGFADRFLNWVDKITAIDASGTSQFDRAMQGLGETLKGLGGIVGDLILKGFDWLSQPGNIDKIKVFFIEIKKAVDLLWPVLDKAFTGLLRFMDGANNLLAFLTDEWATITPGTPLDTIATGLSVARGVITESLNGLKGTLSTMWDGVSGAASSTWSTVSATVSGAIVNIISTLVNGGFQIMGEIGTWPGKITAALGDMGSLLIAAGKALMNGLLNGIKAGFQAVTDFVGTMAGTIASLKGPLPYDRIVLAPNGEALMQGLGDGLASGFENVLAMAKEMARQISQAMSDGTDLSGMLGGNKFPDLTKTLDTLEQERKSLKVQLDNTSDKGMKDQLRDQMRQLQLVKDQLSLDKDKLKNAQKYGGELSNQVGKQDDLGQKIWDAGVNLGKATKDQLMSDLNIGGGAISNLGNELMDWGLNAGKKFIFNVSSMDEALAGQKNIVNREALQFDRR
ncbi:hypothetical protein [Mycobacteroides salmoniphilum]|uniref:hypothetical protein n=1 Tax=Mycobacteroides salmoniphilum TaxID=404941 RepID=UPI0012FF5ED6|nr:hypothetical protein [Mycobacteroides salmoniphilum]